MALATQSTSFRFGVFCSILEKMKAKNFVLDVSQMQEWRDLLLRPEAIDFNADEKEKAQKTSAKIVWGLQKALGKNKKNDLNEILKICSDLFDLVLREFPRGDIDALREAFVRRDGSERTIFAVAVQKKMPMLWFNNLVKSMPALLQTRDSLGHSIYYTALEKRRSALFKQSVGSCESYAYSEFLIDYTSEMDVLAFFYAAGWADSAYFKELLNTMVGNPDPTSAETCSFLSYQDAEGFTALIYALRCGNYKNAQILVSYMRKEACSLLDKQGNSALSYVRSPLDLVESLFYLVPEVSCKKNNQGHTPLQSLIIALSSDALPVILSDVLFQTIYDALCNYASRPNAKPPHG